MAISEKEKEFKRRQFTAELKQLLKSKTKSKLLTKERYDQLLQELLLAQDSDENNNNNNNNTNNSKELAKLMKNYQVVQIHGENRLIQPPNGTSPMKRYVYADELFDILDQIHEELDHCSKAKMVEHLKNVFADITVESVNLFYQMCDVCKAKADRHRGMAKKSTSQKPLMKWHLTIADMTTKPDGDYQYILHYQDLDTKFCALKPLKDYEPETVANELRHIFAWIGAPHVMSSNLRKKFVIEVIKCLQGMYPNLVILPDKQTTEFDTDELEICLEELCNDHHTENWSVLLDDLQFALNTMLPEKGSGITPFEAFFGREPQFGWNIDLLPQVLRSNDLGVEKLKQYQQDYLVKNSSRPSSAEKTKVLSESEDDGQEDEDDFEDSLNSMMAEQSTSKVEDPDQKEDEDSDKEYEATKLVRPPKAVKATSTPKMKPEKKRQQKTTSRTNSKSVSFT